MIFFENFLHGALIMQTKTLKCLKEKFLFIFCIFQIRYLTCDISHSDFYLFKSSLQNKIFIIFNLIMLLFLKFWRIDFQTKDSLLYPCSSLKFLPTNTTDPCISSSKAHRSKMETLKITIISMFWSSHNVLDRHIIYFGKTSSSIGYTTQIEYNPD